MQLHSKYKLIPDVKDRWGAIVLNKRIESDRKYEIDVEFTMQSNPYKSHGFGIMLLGEEPNFPADSDPVFGFRRDYKGLGVFVYRSEKRGKWYIVAMQNKGLRSISDHHLDLDKFIAPRTSCEFDMNEGERGGVRI